MSGIKNYQVSDQKDLEKITTNLTQDKVDRFYPVWFTEHRVNFSTQNGKRVIFRFERPGYIGTLVGSGQEAHYFGSSHVAEAEPMGTELAKTYPGLEINRDSDSNSIGNVTKRLLQGKRVTDVSVMMGDGSQPDYVKVGVEDGSYGVVAFKPGTLVAIQYSDQEGKKIFGVEGKDVGHKRLNIAFSAESGQDGIYTEPVKDPVYKLPNFSQHKKG